MDSEDDAKDTLLDLRLKKRTFRGQSVKGRLKSETLVRSFYPMQAPPVVPNMVYPGMPMQFPGVGGYMGGPPIPVDPRVFGFNVPPMQGQGQGQGQGVVPMQTGMAMEPSAVPVTVAPAISAIPEEAAAEGALNGHAQTQAQGPAVAGEASSISPRMMPGPFPGAANGVRPDRRGPGMGYAQPGQAPFPAGQAPPHKSAIAGPQLNRDAQNKDRSKVG
jgi:hypothetical protein